MTPAEAVARLAGLSATTDCTDWSLYLHNRISTRCAAIVRLFPEVVEVVRCANDIADDPVVIDHRALIRALNALATAVAAAETNKENEK